MPKKKNTVRKDGENTRRPRSTFYYEGKQYEATGKTQKEADQNAAIKKEKLKRGELGISSNMTVKRWAEEWLETYKKPSVTEKSYKNYKRYVDNAICPEIGSLRLTDVKDVHLQKILNGRAGHSHSDLKHLHDTIRAIFKKARASHLLINDPSEFLEMPVAMRGTRRSLTGFERKHFLLAAAKHPAGLMFKIMLYCGLRTGEVVALSWKDIDFENRRIKVVAAMESGKDVIKGPKTEAGIRRVPIPGEIYNELLNRKGSPFEPVFAQQKTGRFHTESSRSKAWRSLKNEIDISMGAKYEKRKAKDKKMRMTKVLSVVALDLVPYCLRHTYCTDLQDKGVPINVAKYLMGHSSISVTANIYTHITDEAIADAAGRIDGKSNGRQKKDTL